MKKSTVGLSMVIMILIITACAGTQARNNILIPSMELAWPNVKADAERGGAGAVLLAEFEQALTARDKLVMVATWPAIQIAAEAGIKSRTDISPGVAASLLERVARFSEAVRRLHGR